VIAKVYPVVMSSPPSASEAHPHSSWYDADDPPPQRELDTCIHCGLCLTACPTYRELKIEPDSPRGRLYLMRGLAEGRIQPSESLVSHLDLCLGCRACETVCPAGVPYGRLLEAARSQIVRRAGRVGWARRLGEWALRSLIPDRGRLSLAADLLRLGQRGPIARFLGSARAARTLPAFMTRGFAMTPRLEPRRVRGVENAALPPGARLEARSGRLVFHPAGEPKASISLFTTCVMEVMQPGINQAVVRLLLRSGCQVTVPLAQTCCGALQAHAGLRAEAKDLSRRNLLAFAGASDPIVTASAGCGAALREVSHLLEGEHGAADFSARVRDVSEVLAEHWPGVSAERPAMARNASAAGPPGGSEPPSGGRPLRIAYHDPCHLAHAQRVRSQPRTLLSRLPGVELIELENADWCCGSAGVYNLAQPEMADRQLARKLDSIEQAAPDVVVASNPGCQLHMVRGADERGLKVRIVHLVEVLDAACR